MFIIYYYNDYVVLLGWDESGDIMWSGWAGMNQEIICGLAGLG